MIPTNSTCSSAMARSKLYWQYCVGIERSRSIRCQSHVIRRANPMRSALTRVRCLYQLTGVDLTQIHGIGPYLALRLISECGTDLTRWPSAKHFTSWLTLSPGSKISGGKFLSAHSRKTIIG